MSRKTVVLIAVILVVVLASCSENPGTTTMKLILSTYSESTEKTLLPSDSSLLDVSKYSVSGVGPNGKTFSIDSDKNSLTIEGLTIGEWSVTAKGINASGTELVTGSLSFRLTDTATPQTIVLDTLVGTGSLRFTVDWSLCDVSNPVVEAFLLGPDMSGTEYSLEGITINKDSKTATVSESLAAGSYRLKVLLYDGSTQIAGLVEAVRISNGTTTEGTHSFHVNEIGPNTLTYISDATGTPIKGSVAIEGSPDTLLAGTTYTCAFTFSEPSKVSTEGLTIEWYYDGSFMSTSELDTTGSSVTFTPKTGVHRIDAVVYNKKLGSTGSTNCSFSVEPDGQAGDLSLAYEGTSTGMSITSKTVIGALPDDKFVVVTPDANRLYICSIHSNSIKVEKTYTNEQLSWIGDISKMFTDYQSNYLVFSGKFINGYESVICLYFDSEANTVSEKFRQHYVINNEAYYFKSISAVAFSDDFIYVADSVLAVDCPLSISAAGAVSVAGAATKKSNHIAVCDADVSANGTDIVTTCPTSTSFISGQMGSKNVPTTAVVSEANTAAGKHIRFVNTQLVVVANNSGFTTYKVVSNGAYTKYKGPINISIVDLEADGSNYFYVLDSSNRIVTFEASAYEVAQHGNVELPSPVQSFALTEGHFIVVMQNLQLNVYDIIE